MAQMPPQPPPWDTLPQSIRNDLQGKCDKWYQDAQSPHERVALLNTYAALRGHDLWKHIDKCVDNTSQNPYRPGRMLFQVNNVQGLRNELFQRRDFTNPTRSFWNWLTRGSELWDSRANDTSRGQLHLKQFQGSWNPQFVEAHIDVEGVSANPAQLYRHWFDNPWQDPFKANRSLIQSPSLRQYLPPSLLGAK